MRAWSRPAVAAMLAAVALWLVSGCDRAAAWTMRGPRAEPARVSGELAGAIIVDLRPPQDFDTGHIPWAHGVSPSDLHGYLHAERSRGDRPVVLVSEGELDAQLALPSARQEGFGQVYVLAGGMRLWREEGRPLSPGPEPARLGPIAPPLKELTWTQQLVGTSAGAVVKPAYMLLSLLLALFLLRARSPAMRLLFHGCVWFLAGETFCAVDYFFHGRGFFRPFDMLHGAGMVAMFALAPWSLYKLLDDRVLHFSDPDRGCAVQRLCTSCWKRDPARCGIHDLMLLLVAACAVLSLMPLSLELRPIQVVSPLFGTAVDYGMPIVNMLVEQRLYPLVAALLFLVTFGLMWGGTRSVRRAEPWFFAGFGFMGFSLFRHFVNSTWRDALYWADFWEETTELLLVLSVGLFLVLFRRQLGLAGEEPASGPGR